MDRRDTSTLGQIRELAQDLQGARTARRRYEISRKINNLSKHAQADSVGFEHLKVWMNAKRWELSNTRAEYDRKADIFYVYALPREPAGRVCYINFADILALVSRDTHQIIGFQVDNFQSVWLPAHPELQVQANKAKTPIAFPSLRRFNGTWRDFTTAVVTVLARVPKDIPPSARLSC